MPIRIGDRVRIISCDRKGWIGDSGIVTNTHRDKNQYTVKIDSRPKYYYEIQNLKAENLELITLEVTET